MEDLVLALPSRDFIALRGFTHRLDLAVLEALQHETWLAVPAAIREDPLAVAVELGVVVERDGALLLESDGRLLMRGPVLPEELAPGAMLVALRRAAEIRTEGRVGSRLRAELIGWFHDPLLAPRTLLLVYRAWAAGGMPSAPGTWLTRASAASLLQDRVEQSILAGLPPAPMQ